MYTAIIKCKPVIGYIIGGENSWAEGALPPKNLHMGGGIVV